VDLPLPEGLHHRRLRRRVRIRGHRDRQDPFTCARRERLRGKVCALRPAGVHRPDPDLRATPRSRSARRLCPALTTIDPTRAEINGHPTTTRPLSSPPAARSTVTACSAAWSTSTAEPPDLLPRLQVEWWVHGFGAVQVNRGQRAPKPSSSIGLPSPAVRVRKCLASRPRLTKACVGDLVGASPR
jgi:hypothetical protein